MTADLPHLDVIPRLFRDTRGILVESMFWDARTAELVWVDITAGNVHRGHLDGAIDGSDDRVSALPPTVSAVQPADGGGYVVALRDSIVRMAVDGTVTPLATVEHAHSGIRFNEGKTDPFGRFIVGSMNTTTGAADGALYSFDHTGSARLLRGGFSVTNGMEWSDDTATMFVTDTATKTVYRASYSADGELGELEPFLVGRNSDGLALDVDGFFWNGIYGDGEVVRWGPDGLPCDRVAVPAPNVTSVAFGAPDLSSLFIGTARENLTEEQLEQSPHSGGIFVVDGLATGRPASSFTESSSNRRE